MDEVDGKSEECKVNVMGGSKIGEVGGKREKIVIVVGGSSIDEVGGKTELNAVDELAAGLRVRSERGERW